MIGRQVLGRARTWVEDYILTAPSSGYRPRLWDCDAQTVANKTTELQRTGYTSLGPIFDSGDLAEISALIDEAVAGRLGLVQAVWSERVMYWHLQNPLRLHPVLFTMAACPMALAVCEAYMRRPCYLADVDLRRIVPVAMDEVQSSGYSSSNWHRDNRGRQVKVMVYLSDVGPDDSCFSLLPSTHARCTKRRRSYMETRVTDAEAESLGIAPLDWLGRAGEAMLFDTNLVHRLRRKPTAQIRDSLTYYYTPGQSLFPLDYDPKLAVRLLPEVRHLVGDPGGLLRRPEPQSASADAA